MPIKNIRKTTIDLGLLKGPRYYSFEVSCLRFETTLSQWLISEPTLGCWDLYRIDEVEGKSFHAEKEIEDDIWECFAFAERWTGEQDKEEEMRDFELANANEKLVLGSKMREIDIINQDRDPVQQAWFDKQRFGIEVPVRGEEVKNSTHRSLNMTEVESGGYEERSENHSQEWWESWKE